MKVTFLTSSNSRLSGGLFYTIQSLTKQLLKNEIDVSLLSYNDQYSSIDRTCYGNVPLLSYHRSKCLFLKTLGFSRDIYKMLQKEKPQIIHQQGIWMYHSYAALLYKRKNPSVIKIIEPHGMLDPWAIHNSAWKKKIVGYLYENENLKTADCIHALCKSEYESIRSLGLKNPVAIIPNGIDIPLNPIYCHNSDKKILLFIGRIHPKKGLKELLLALKILKENNSSFCQSWKIRIAGWSQNGHIDELKKIVLENNLEKYVEFIGPIYGTNKEKELCCASAFILPSFSEGLPMSILEAWAYKLPVIMTEYCNIPEGFSMKAAVFIKPTPQSIANGLEELSKMSEVVLGNMGNNGYNLVNRKFSWNHIAKQTISLYQWLINGGEKPEFVYLKD